MPLYLISPVKEFVHELFADAEAKGPLNATLGVVSEVTDWLWLWH